MRGPVGTGRGFFSCFPGFSGFSDDGSWKNCHQTKNATASSQTPSETQKLIRSWRN